MMHSSRAPNSSSAAAPASAQLFVGTKAYRFVSAATNIHTSQYTNIYPAPSLDFLLRPSRRGDARLLASVIKALCERGYAGGRSYAYYFPQGHPFLPASGAQLPSGVKKPRPQRSNNVKNTAPRRPTDAPP